MLSWLTTAMFIAVVQCSGSIPHGKLKVSWAAIIPSTHCNDVIMSAMASQITSLTIVYLAIYSDTDQRKHQSSASLAFVRWIHRWPMNSPHKGPVTRKMFPFDDAIVLSRRWASLKSIDCVTKHMSVSRVPQSKLSVGFLKSTIKFGQLEMLDVLITTYIRVRLKT